MDLQPKDWLATVRQEYLQRFIRQGGSAVKFVVTESDLDKAYVRTNLTKMAQHDGFSSVHVDAQDTKVHMTDRFFHQIAKLIDWDDLSYTFVSRLLTENGYQVPAERSQFSLTGVAALNERAEPLLRRDLHSWLERAIYRDPHMCQEFRLAMIRLCLAQLDVGDSSSFLTTAVKEWLRGELRQLSALKEALIFQKIVRHNARHMVESLTRWLRLVGQGGLVLSVDLGRYLVSKRPAQPEGFYYSASATMDVYEMLRQFIDGTDEIEGLFLVVLAPAEFLTDGRRGLNRYEALKLRVWDEVRDRHRQNPLSALIRLSSSSSVGQEEGSSPSGHSIQAANASGDLFHQRVIEALRSGVPNRDVVRALGSNQPEIESQFRQRLQLLKAQFANGMMTKGLLIEGGFGTGKSHALEALHHIALEENFVCSPIVISKETPFYNVATLYRAAIDAAMVPQKRGHALTEVAGELNFQSPLYSEFYEWANRQDGPVDSRFGATLYLYEQMVNDPELSHRMIRFWAGDPLSNSELKKYLQGSSSSVSYPLNKISVQDLALQRFRFVARLMVAAGYSGWMVFIDEAEIIARYSFKQRSKSYGELARWMGTLDTCQFPGLASVVALTDDFQSVILEEKGDREKIATTLGEADSDAARTLAIQAEKGIQLIEQERASLVRPNDQVVDETYQKIRSIHASAYGWDPPQVSSVEQLSSTRMREYVRGWITAWDLKRLAPDEDVDIEVTEVKQDYTEDLDLEVSLEDEELPLKEVPSEPEDPLLAVAMENQSPVNLMEN